MKTDGHVCMVIGWGSVYGG